MELIGGYGNFKNELDIGVEYKKRGYYTVIIENPAVKTLVTIIMSVMQQENGLKEEKQAPTGLKRLWKI